MTALLLPPEVECSHFHRQALQAAGGIWIVCLACGRAQMSPTHFQAKVITL